MKAFLILVLGSFGILKAQLAPSQPAVPPRTWDTRALSDWATPLATINIRPGHFSEEEYYQAPLDNYRTYPVYLLDREPAGYWQTLNKKKPEPLVDAAKTDRALNWIAAGRRVDSAGTVSRLRPEKSTTPGITRGWNTRHLPWVVTPEGIALTSPHARRARRAISITARRSPAKGSDAAPAMLFQTG